MTIEAIDVECPTCHVHAGTPCRSWLCWFSGAIRRSHRARHQRRRDVLKMHRLVMLLLLGEWPSRDEVESIAQLGDGEDRERAAMLLTLIDATGYEGELF